MALSVASRHLGVTQRFCPLEFGLSSSFHNLCENQRLPGSLASIMNDIHRLQGLQVCQLRCFVPLEHVESRWMSMF